MCEKKKHVKIDSGSGQYIEFTKGYLQHKYLSQPNQIKKARPTLVQHTLGGAIG